MIPVQPGIKLCLLGALRASQQICSHKEAYCVIVAHFYSGSDSLLPFASDSSSAPTSHEYYSDHPPFDIHKLVSMCSCAPRLRREKGGVSPRRRATTPVCVWPYVCVRLKTGGERSRRLLLLVLPRRSLASEAPPVSLSWSFLWLCAGLVSEWLNEWMGCQEEMLRWGVTDENGHSSVDGDPPCPYHRYLGRFRAPGVSTTTIMGCNLCSLQKREEHYRLLYEIAQVSAGTAGSGINYCVFAIHYACREERSPRLEACWKYCRSKKNGKERNEGLICKMKVRWNNSEEGDFLLNSRCVLSNEQLLREQRLCSPFILLDEPCWESKFLCGIVAPGHCYLECLCHFFSWMTLKRCCLAWLMSYKVVSLLFGCF